MEGNQDCLSSEGNLDLTYILNKASAYTASSNYEEATKLLSDSLKSLTNTLGDLHPSLHPLYYLYGDTVLQQYETSNDTKLEENNEKVLVTSSSPENDSEDLKPNDEQAKEFKESDSEQDSDQDSSVESESISSNISINDILTSEKEADSSHNKEETDSVNNNEETDSVNHKEKEENSEQELDLQLAWENLETARVIIQAHKPIDLVSLFKTQSRLGDLQSYLENFEQACQEYLSAIDTLNKIDTSPSRNQATLHYMVGHNYLQIKGKETLAEFHLNKSYKILESFIELVKEPELELELKAVMEEIKMKIEDAIEQHESFKALEQEKLDSKDEFDPPLIAGPKIEVIKKLPEQHDPDFPDSNDNKKIVKPC